MKRTTSFLWAGALVVGTSGCTVEGGIQNQGSLKVTVTEICDATGCGLPTAEAPLPPNLREDIETIRFTVEAVDVDGNTDTGFNGFVRLGINPGSVNLAIDSNGVPHARNVQLVAGHAAAEVQAEGMFGETRLWVEDLGYEPAAPGETPTCSNGADDDGDVPVDFPNDPGCAFADDMSEEFGTLLTGVSQPLYYDLPTLADVQGYGATTPFKATAVHIKTTAPSEVVVTRVSANGFYVSDLNEPEYGHMYAYNFNAPYGMRVCDRITFLGGTATEFFGFTEITFPSYEVGLWNPTGAPCALDTDCPAGEFCRLGGCQPCRVPEPAELTPSILQSDGEMEKLESGLVRVEQVTIPQYLSGVRLNADLDFNPDVEIQEDPCNRWDFAPKPRTQHDGAPVMDASYCDLSGDGLVDFMDPLENDCSNSCARCPQCSGYYNFGVYNDFKVHRPNSGLMVQVNASAVGGFDPRDHKGKTLAFVTGTLGNFSGGSLNWTIHVRCGEDLVCNFDDACSADVVPASQACFSPPTEEDNDAGTY